MTSIPSLDGLRAVSIMIVILAHLQGSNRLPGFLDRLAFLQGHFGVLVFFVISGFLITYLLLRERERNGTIDMKKFYLRRTFRIVPVYFLYLIVAFVLDRMLDTGNPATYYLNAITYTTNFVRYEQIEYSVWKTWLVSHSWSLAVEEQFYLLWPWLVRSFAGGASALAATIIVMGPLARLIEHMTPEYNTILLTPFFRSADSLMIGAVTAIAMYRRPEIFAHRFWSHPATRVLSVLVAIGTDRIITQRIMLAPAEIIGPTVASAAVCVFMISLIVHRQGVSYRFLNWKPVATIGVLSYSIYLWQQIFLLNAKYPTSDYIWRTFPINLILVGLTAWASYTFWEKPFLRIKDRFRTAV